VIISHDTSSYGSHGPFCSSSLHCFRLKPRPHQQKCRSYVRLSRTRGISRERLTRFHGIATVVKPISAISVGFFNRFVSCPATLNIARYCIYITMFFVILGVMDQQFSMITVSFQTCCLLTLYPVYDVCHGRHKPLIGQNVTETTTGQTQQLLIVLSTTDVMWLLWHIVSVNDMNGWASISLDCHSHEQKLY